MIFMIHTRTILLAFAIGVITTFVMTSFVDASKFEAILRIDTVSEGSTTVDNSVKVFREVNGRSGSLYVVEGDNTLVSNDRLSNLISRTQDPVDTSSAPHLSGMRVMDVNDTHLYVQDATVKRIIDNGSEIKIIGTAHSENPVVYCHGMPIATLGMKQGQAIAIGNEFSEIVSIPFEHQNHVPELIHTTESINPFFEKKTFLVLKEN